jgi:UDP-N-acetylmuramate--alanine ligase
VKLLAPVHFVGISGIGMSALARVLSQRGVAVSGSSDRRTRLTAKLEAEGISVSIGHRPGNLGGARTLVVSSAIASSNPELAEASRRGLPVLRRGALLALLLNEAKGVAIAGTHGKTTSSAMVAAILEAAKLEPTWTVGGERVESGLNARVGRGDWFVAESDESDRSFLELRPFASLITNVENDHVASDAEFASLAADFERFAAQTLADGFVCIGIDEPNAAALARKPRACRTVTFGAAGDYRYTGFSTGGFALEFRAWHGARELGAVRMPMVGEMNARNALGALAAAMEIGVPFATAAAALAEFRGVRRRFDILLRLPDLVVVDDYAHHPTAIAATIAAARANARGPLVAVFQPHRYTRTAYLAAEFADALGAADRVVLTDIYAASEPPIAGVDAGLIGERLRASGVEVDYVPHVADLPPFLLRAAAPGTTVLMLGAGTITDAAAELADLGRALPAKASA